MSEVKTIKEILMSAIKEAEKTHDISISYIDVDRTIVDCSGKEIMSLQLSVKAK